VTPQLVRVIERLLPPPAVRVLKMVRARARFALGLQPLSREWRGRGEPIHRQYVEQFLREHSSAIQGHCLEFQDDTYVTRLGGSRVTALDILHRDPDNPDATIVADLTRKTDIPDSLFDCIICTYVLNVATDPSAVVSELHRILKPRGVLLVAVPHIGIDYPQHHELWRYTEGGLRALLERRFAAADVLVRGFGNSLTAAGGLRGLVARDFGSAELEYHDPRFAMAVCGRALKRGDG
jgi:SAM-dependent methyltransferase